MTLPISEFNVPADLQEAGITRIAKEGPTIIIEHAEGHKRIVIYKDWHKTTKHLRAETKGLFPEKIIQGIETCISSNYLQLLNTGEGSNNGSNRTHPSPATSGQPENSDVGVEISFDEWQNKLVEKYNHFQQTVNTEIPDVWHSMEFVLSIKTILNIADITLPFAGIILGAPSSKKTISIEMLRKHRGTFYTDKFTPKAFVSHSTSVSKEKLEEIDLLPKIKNKVALTPELGPLFAAKDDDLVENLGILTRILDGHGYESDSGAHGHRGYNGEWMFVQVGAAVDIPRKVYKYLGTLGPKLYFLRIPKGKKTDEEYLEQLSKNDFKRKLGTIESALMDYLKWFEASPVAEYINGLPKIQWDSSKDAEKAVKNIIKLGKLLAHLRAVIPTWETYDPQSQGSEYAYSIPTIEEPDRAMQQLYNLARGHALTWGRNYITTDDLTIVVKVVLSTAMIERVKVFDLLIRNGGKLTTSQVTGALNTTNPTAKRAMTELKALGLVSMEQTTDEHNNQVYQIQLKPEFQWFLENEFQELRHGFELANFEEEGLKEKTPPDTKPRVDPNDSLFKEICKELAKDGIIQHDVLRRQLLNTNKFHASDATQAITDHLKTGYLEEGEWHTYRIKEET